ncbi:MAG: substrate-binding domain-containing protein [Pseudomonadota bacterium]
MAVNLKTLSEQLGLSQTTVSRGLNGYPDVSETTRKRILEAAKKYNYSPNSRAKSLATGKSRTIGHVIPTNSQHEMVNPIFGDFVAGASTVYAENGYSMLLTRVPEDAEIDTYNRMKSSGAVDGIVLQGPSVDDKRIDFLRKLDIPYAVHGRSSGITSDYPWVDVNNRRAFQRATDLLLDLGHRNIALLNGLEVMDFAGRRKQGFIDAFKKRSIEASPDLIFSAEMTEAYGYKVTTEVLATGSPPTAFLSSSLITALGIRRAIEDQGLRMGRDISVVTHDDMLSYLPNGDSEPVFTATRSSVSLAGRILAQMLIEKIEEKSKGPDAHLLEAELVLGQSTGPVSVR